MGGEKPTYEELERLVGELRSEIISLNGEASVSGREGEGKKEKLGGARRSEGVLIAVGTELKYANEAAVRPLPGTW